MSDVDSVAMRIEYEIERATFKGQFEFRSGLLMALCMIRVLDEQEREKARKV